MCLNQSALSCSGTHFIKPSSWGRGSMRPHIYHTNPSGLSPSCTDSMCVIGARPPDQMTHWLPALIHFHFHLPLCVLRFLICTLPLSLSPSLSVCKVLSTPPPPLSFISLSAKFFLGGSRCYPALNGFWTLLFLLCFISFPYVSPISPVVWKVFRSFTVVKIATQHFKVEVIEMYH